MNKSISNDLKTLKDYRNGLFHWKAETKNYFALSKVVLRIIFWSIKFSKQNPLHSRAPLNIPRHNSEKLIKLQTILKKSRNEFNVLRRIYKCDHELGTYHKITRNLKAYRFGPDFKKTSYKCLACNKEMYVGCSTVQTLKNSKVRQSDFGLWCAICEFYLHENEYRVITHDRSPTLRELFATL